MLKTSIFTLVPILLWYGGNQNVQSAKILALMNLASPSHYIFNRALLLELSRKGHQVTVISADKEKQTVPNFTNILLEGIYNVTEENYDYEEFAKMSFLDFLYVVFDWGSDLCEKQLQTKGAQELLNYESAEHFDLIITEISWGECFFAFIHKFGNPPVVATSGVGIPPWLSVINRNPENPSFIPNFLLPYTSCMTFSQRLHNFVANIILMVMHEYYHIPKQEVIARKYFKEDFPSLKSIQRNFSVVLVNTAPGFDEPRPLLPNVISIGGMHIKAKPDTLPKDLQQFLDEAKDGFIYFSLGTNLRSDALTPEKREALLEAFSELSQRVLWKFETDYLEGLPPNVRINKWLPQSDILAHPNIKMFITHCGKMSSMEAVYRGVPIVGIPFFLDQILNLQKFISKGVGVHLDYITLTKESVLTAVNKILTNESYCKNIKKLSAIFRDQPETGLERAVFWTEYVLRHNGAPQLRSAAMDLNWHEYLLLDVLLVFILLVLSLIYVIWVFMKMLKKLLVYQKKSYERQVKKQN